MGAESLGLEAFIKMDAFRRAAGEYNRLIDGMNKETDNTARGITGKFGMLGDSVLRVTGYLGGALVTAAGAGATALTGLAVSGVKAAMDMEAQLSGIAAVLNRTKDEVQPLSDLIIDLGLDPRLKVTAEEAAEAIELLARNGLSMTEIMDGAAFSTVLLANSTGTTFGNAANIATDAMAIFNIEAKDMQTAVDGITSVTTNSKFTIDDFAMALANGGAVASSSGVEFDDFNTVIAAISPQFSSGMTAGTSFKNMLLRLAPTTNTAKDAMQELGLISEDGVNAFYDATGSLKDMDEVAQILQDTFVGLSEEQRGQYLRTIFGNEAMGAAIGLMELGTDAGMSAADAFGELADTMGQTDAAQAAATRMDNLAGVLEIIEGVIDTVKLQIGQEFLPLLRDLADRLLVVADEVGPKIVAFFSEIASFIQGFTSNLSDGMSVWDAAVDSLLTWTQVGETYGGVILDIVEKIESFISAVSTFVSDHAEAFRGALIAIGIALGGMAVISAIGGAIALLTNPITLIVAAVGLLGAAWAENWGGIREKTQAAIDKVLAVFNQLKGWFEANKGPILDFAEGTFGRVRDTLVSVAKDIGTFVVEQFNKVRDWFVENQALIGAYAAKIGTMWATVAGVLIAVASKLLVIVLGAWNVVKPILGGIVDLVMGWAKIFMQIVTGDWAGAWETLKQTVSNAWASVQEAFMAFLDWVAGWFGSTWEGVKQTWADNWEAFKEIIALAWEAIKTAVSEKVMAIRDGIATWFEEIKTTVSEKVDAMKTAVLTKYQEIKDGILERIRSLFESMGIDFDAMVARWSAIWEDVKLIASTIWDNIVTAVLEKVEIVRAFIDEKIAAIRDFWAQIWDEISAKALEIWVAISTAVSEKVEDVRSAIEGKVVKIKTKWGEIWDEISKKLSEIWDAIKKAAAEKVKEVYTAVTEKIEEIRTWISGKIEAFKSIGESLITGIKDGISTGAGALLEAVTSAVEDAIAAAKRALGIASPSKVFMEFGGYSMEGLAIGFKNMASKTANVIGQVLGGLPGLDMNVSHMLQTAVPGGNGLGAAMPTTMSLDASSLAALLPSGGDTTKQYILNNQSAATNLEIENAFGIMEMLGA